MTDQTTSGANAATPVGTFGSTRGSGLARGKRVTPAAAPAAAATPGAYRPTTVQVITPASEYRNPFATHEAPEAVPAASAVTTAGLEPEAPAPIPQATSPEPTPVFPQASVPTPPPAREALESPVAPPHAVAAEIAMETSAAEDAEPASAPEPQRAEIKILPAAESRRPAVSWEGASAPAERAASAADRPRRDDRPVFRPESRRDGPIADRSEGREPRRDFGRGGEPRPAARERAPQPLRPTPAPAPREPQAERPGTGGGFFGWLKGLFGGKPKAGSAGPTPAAGEARRDDDRPGGREGGHDGQRPRRRRRGGRGQGFSPGGGEAGSHGSHGGSTGQAGPREGAPFRRDRAEGGGDSRGPAGDEAGGPRRRRHRGGRGRNRGGDHRPEGQKGGGAI
jgi:translation initiation factor IF-2